MDKKNLILGVLAMTAAILLMVWSNIDQQRRAAELAKWRLEHPEQVTAPGNLTATATSGNQTTAMSPNSSSASEINSSTAPNSATATAPPPEPAPTTPAKTAKLENDDIVITLTEDGGAIQAIGLKKYPAHLGATDPVLFNDGALEPALALDVPTAVNPQSAPVNYWTWNRGAAVATGTPPGMPPVPLVKRYALDPASSNTTVTFHGSTTAGLEITRTYTLSADAKDSYQIEHTTTFANHGAATLPPQRVLFNVGTPPPTPDSGSLANSYLNFGYYDGKSASFVGVSDFLQANGLLGMVGAHPARDFMYTTQGDGADLQWASVKDQFFTAVLTPHDFAGSGFFVEAPPITEDGVVQSTVTADMELTLAALPPGAEKKLVFSYYAGPKDYVQLDRLGQKQEEIMQFGMFGFISKYLLVLIIGLEKALHYVSPTWSWGWSIIAFTIIIKLLTWPLTAQQVRMSKRMAQLKGPLDVLKLKYKDKPEKLQAETMELWKKHKVNPFAGCAPMFIQIPIFWGFYSMLRTAAELRFASFLWIQNLAAPDTIGHIAGISINLLPMIYTSCNFLQMRMMPSPTTDDTQRKIMQFMPLMFFFTFYSMPAGLVLYYTCQSILTILQQKVTRMRLDAETPGPGALPAVPVGPSIRRK